MSAIFQTEITLLEDTIAALTRSLEHLRERQAMQTQAGVINTSLTINECRFSYRLRSAIINGISHYDSNGAYTDVRCKTLGELAKLTRAEFLRMPNLGWLSYREIWRLCVQYGYWKADDAAYRPPAKYLAPEELAAAYPEE